MSPAARPAPTAATAPAAPRAAELARAPAWMYALVALAALALFWSALRGEFVYDDQLLVQRNPLIASFANWPKAFTQSYWDFLDPDEASQIGYWRPLTALALMLGRALGGGAPWGFHALSLALHALASAVALQLALRLTRSRWLAFGAALVFALHPVHVESVAWISALNDPLHGLFTLLALERFLAWRERGGAGRPWAAAAWLVPALLAKEPAAVAPLVAFALDGLAQRVSLGLRERLRAQLPFAIALLAYYLARVAVFGQLGAGLGGAHGEMHYSAPRLALARAELFGGALALLAWPAKLALFRPATPSVDWSSAPIWIALACSAAWFAASLWAWKRAQRELLAPLLMLLALLLPLIGPIESLGQFPLSDRFLYLPVLPAAVLFVLALRRAVPAGAVVALALAAAAGCAWRAALRIPSWRDPITLCRTATLDTPRSPYPHWGLGRALLEAHRASGDPRELAEALAAFEKAQDLCEAAQQGDRSIFATSDDVLQSNLGLAYALLAEAQADEYHDYDTPLRVFETVAKARPDSERPLIGQASALMAKREYDAAERALGRAIALNARSVEAYHNLGVLLMQRGEWDRARRAFEQASELRPADLEERMWIARALFQAGWSERAGQMAEEQRLAHPDEAEPYVLLASIARAGSDNSRALALLDQALQRAPRHAFALHLRGQILYELGESAEAIASFRRACDLDPLNFEYHYNLGALLQQTGAFEAALPFLERAYAIGGPATQLELLRRVLEQAPSPDGALFQRLVRVERSREAFDLALQWAQLAAQRAPDSSEAQLLLGGELERVDRLEEARQALERATELAPASFEAWFELGTVLARAQREADALAAWKRCLELLPRVAASPEMREQMRERVEQLIAEHAPK